MDCSSNILLSPMIIGPPSAMIVDLGCKRDLGPMEILPTSLLSKHTTAPWPILRLKI